MWSPETHSVLAAPFPVNAAATTADIANLSRIAKVLTAPLLEAHRQITLHITAWPRLRTSTTPEILAPFVPPEPIPLLDHIPADQHSGATCQHTTDTLRLGEMATGIEKHYHNLTHITHINHLSDIIPATPPDDHHVPHHPYECTNDAMQLHDIMLPADAREFDP